jgi:hypothetical protein
MLSLRYGTPTFGLALDRGAVPHPQKFNSVVVSSLRLCTLCKFGGGGAAAAAYPDLVLESCDVGVRCPRSETKVSSCVEN